MPEKSLKRVRHNPHDVVGELKRFLGICAQARKTLDPENIKANVGQFFEGMDEDSKKLVSDVAGMIRRPK